MVLFDLNVAPVDEEDVFQEVVDLEKLETEINYKNFPIKKRILEVWREEQSLSLSLSMDQDLSLPPKKRFSGMKRPRVDDDRDDSFSKKQKCQEVETITACFTPKTPSSETESSVQKLQKPKPRIKIIHSQHRPSSVYSSHSSDAVSKLLPDYVKNKPEFKNMSEAKLVIEKTLTQADIDRQQDRLSIPYKQIKTKFLSDSELGWLGRENPKNSEGKGNNNNKKKNHVRVKVIGPSSVDQVRDMSITRWNYKGSDGFRFAITGGWTRFLKDNDLKLNDLIQVVSFRVDNRLCLAILKPHSCL